MLVERPAQTTVLCDQQECGSEADVSFFQARMGALFQRTGIDAGHASAPLPAIAPEGSIITMTAARS